MAGARVKIYGARGSFPVSGAEFSRYGGATSCVLVNMDGQYIMLDAGTGLLAAEAELTALPDKLNILLTHGHLDHIQGLSCCSLFWQPERRIEIFSVPRDGLSTREQVEKLLSPPLWPVGPEAFQAEVTYTDIAVNAKKGFHIGPVRVDTMESNHPGGSTVFKLTGSAASVVYATDFEARLRISTRLERLADRCDLLIIDAQYNEEEYASHRGWGHSTWRQSAAIGERCEARQVLLFHHDVRRTDAELDAVQKVLDAQYPRCRLARSGEEIMI